MAALALALVALFCVSLAMGRFTVPLVQTIRIILGNFFPLNATWSDQMENVIYNIRMPRILGALLVGGALSLSGAAYQGMFRNPLVSPDLLGVSAGACVGAAIAILMRLAAWQIQFFAFLGGILAVGLTLSIPKVFRNNTALMLVLAGVIVSGFMNAILGTLKYIADPESELASIVYWTMGSLSTVRISNVLVVLPAMLGSMIGLILLRWRINLMALGDEQAASLGVNVKNMRRLIVLFATALTATAICLSGTIGWVGLIIPHLGRLIVGHDNRYLIPASTLLGASFLIIVDTAARNLTGSETPLSILTGLIGTPVFLFLLLVQRTKIN